MSGLSAKIKINKGPRNGRTSLKQFSLLIIFSFIVFISGLCLLELTLRSLGYGYPSRFFIASHINGRKVFINNYGYTCRFMPPAFIRLPSPCIVPAVKSARAYRIFVVGESAAKGSPDASFSFSRILQTILRDRYPNMQFEVVNISMPIINSHILLPIARECAGLKPDLFIIYMGNNEVVGPYGYGTAFLDSMQSLPMIQANILARSYKTGQLINNLWQHLSNSGNVMDIHAIREIFLTRLIPADDPHLSFVYSYFQQNLGEIVRTGRRSGAKVIVCTVAVNLKDCAPFASSHRPQLNNLEVSTWEKTYQMGVRCESSGQYEQAIRHYLQAAKLDGQFAELQFRLGRCYLAVGQYETALQRFNSARDLDTLRFRADTTINKIIRELAKKNTDKGMYLVDAEEALAKNSPNRLPGHELFYDHVHMNFSGNYQLALSIYHQVDRVLNETPGLIAMPSAPLSESECAKRLCFSGYDRYRITKVIFRNLAVVPFGNQIDHGHQIMIDHLKNELKTLREKVRKESLEKDIVAYRNTLAAVGDNGDWVLHRNFSRLLQEYGDTEAAMKQSTLVFRQMPPDTDYLKASELMGN